MLRETATQLESCLKGTKRPQSYHTFQMLSGDFFLKPWKVSGSVGRFKTMWNEQTRELEYWALYPMTIHPRLATCSTVLNFFCFSPLTLFFENHRCLLSLRIITSVTPRQARAALHGSGGEIKPEADGNHLQGIWDWLVPIGGDTWPQGQAMQAPPSALPISPVHCHPLSVVCVRFCARRTERETPLELKAVHLTNS